MLRPPSPASDEDKPQFFFRGPCFSLPQVLVIVHSAYHNVPFFSLPGTATRRSETAPLALNLLAQSSRDRPDKPLFPCSPGLATIDSGLLARHPLFWSSPSVPSSR